MSMHAFLPSGDDALVALFETDVPEPAPHEALVEVAAFSPNRGEIDLLAASRQDPPGKDLAGRVVRAAADRSGPPEGARVVAHVERGGWAQRLAVPAERLVVVPDAVPLATAAALPMAGLTALRLLRAADGLAGGRLLLTGASGGVGHYVVELATALGVRVTAIARTRERGERLLALGAETVVADVADAQGPFDVVMEAVGGEAFDAALGKLTRGGLLLWFGQLSGRPAQADVFTALRGPIDATIRSFFYWAQTERDAEDLATLVRLVASDRLHPEIGLTADWSETPAVLAAVRDREVRGSAVLTVSDEA